MKAEIYGSKTIKLRLFRKLNRFAPEYEGRDFTCEPGIYTGVFIGSAMNYVSIA